DDRRFLSTAAPYIAHGLHTAKLIDAPTYSVAPGTPIGGPGVVVMNRHGRILGLDQKARSLFLQVAMREKLQWSAFAEPHLRALLDHIARKLREVFYHRERSSDNNGLPSACILSHRAGIVLRLTGHAAPSDDAQGLFVVLVEQIEPEALAQARLMYRHGLAPREAEMLVMLQRGKSVACVAKDLGISTTTAKTYVRNLIEKLDAPNFRTLRAGLQHDRQEQSKI
ncbi:MAG TPA: helix-turn-helix transcriptional regulator, partial [Candidatus Binataceae bacterium]|nr:helix-turn-helix transcriptional regulator [Candidatus Binataceae bacterium]